MICLKFEAIQADRIIVKRLYYVGNGVGRIFQGVGDQRKKTRPRNITIKPFSTLSVPRMKIHVGRAPFPCIPLPTPMSPMYVDYRKALYPRTQQRMDKRELSQFYFRKMPLHQGNNIAQFAQVHSIDNFKVFVFYHFGDNAAIF